MKHSAIDNAAHAAVRISIAITIVLCQAHSKCSDDATLAGIHSPDAFQLRQIFCQQSDRLDSLSGHIAMVATPLQLILMKHSRAGAVTQ